MPSLLRREIRLSIDAKRVSNEGSFNRISFDPDSITAAFALQKIIPADKLRRIGLYGLQLDEALPRGEFSRTDPSSNIIFRSGVVFGLKPWIPAEQPRAFATLHPISAIEAGKNLDKPSSIAMTAVNLSHYDAILRGVLGADQAFSYESKDKTTDVFTLTTLYHVRLPALDEPFVRTSHQLTSVQLTAKARHWVEVDANYSPFGFQYLAGTCQDDDPNRPEHRRPSSIWR